MRMREDFVGAENCLLLIWANKTWLPPPPAVVSFFKLTPLPVSCPLTTPLHYIEKIQLYCLSVEKMQYNTTLLSLCSPQGAGFLRRGWLNKLLHPFHSFLTSSFRLPVLSTIFHSKNSPQYLHFQLSFYSFFLPNWPFSCIYLQHKSSLYNSSCSLRSPSDPACLPCAASCVWWRMGSWWLRSPRGVQHASSAWTSPWQVVGLARHSQSAGCALP